MKTRKQNYSPGNIAKAKKVITTTRAVKELSNSPPRKAISERPKRHVRVIKKENDNNSPVKAKPKKSQTDLKATGNRSSSLVKPKGKQSETNETAGVKRKAPLRKVKVPKDVEVTEENRVILRKRRGKQPEISTKQKRTTKVAAYIPQNVEVIKEKGRRRQPKTIAKQEMTMKNPSNIEKSEEMNDVEVIGSKNYIPLKELNCETPKPEDNMERSHEENVKDSDEDIEIAEDNSVEFLEEHTIKVQDENDVESPRENNIEIQDVLEDRDQEAIVNDDSDDDRPDEVAFGSSKEEIMDKLKIIKDGIEKIRDERKEINKRIQDRNILQKKQKKDRVAEIQKRRLSPQLLEYVSKLPKTVKDFETTQTKPEEIKYMETDEEEKYEELIESEEFISVHGSTEFKPLHLKTVLKKPPSVTDNIAKFKENAFFGSRNKRESVWEMKSNLLKQAVAGKL